MDILNKVKELMPLFEDGANMVLDISTVYREQKTYMEILFNEQPTFVDLDRDKPGVVLLDSGNLLMDVIIDDVVCRWIEEVQDGEEIQAAES
jgi:hypothetical protein